MGTSAQNVHCRKQSKIVWSRNTVLPGIILKKHLSSFNTSAYNDLYKSPMDQVANFIIYINPDNNKVIIVTNN